MLRLPVERERKEYFASDKIDEKKTQKSLLLARSYKEIKFYRGLTDTSTTT